MAIPQRLTPSTEDLQKFYVGKDINDVPRPAVVLDKAKMRRHCQSLLEAVNSLGVDFRVHVKTHKVSCHLHLPTIQLNADLSFRLWKELVSKPAMRAGTSSW